MNYYIVPAIFQQKRAQEGCARQFVTVNYQELPNPDPRLKTLVPHESMHAVMQHTRKSQEKYAIPLAPIHEELRAGFKNHAPKASDDQHIVLASITIQFKVGGPHQETMQHVTFPIKIPAYSIPASTLASGFAPELLSFNRTDIVSLSDESQFLSELKNLYSRGKKAADPLNAQTATTPDFKLKAKKDSRLLSHSEQALAPYLCSDTGITMLINRFIATVRGKDLAPIGSRLKICTVALHLHGKKTPCTTCENVLVGLNHSQTQGFLKNFQQEILRRTTEPMDLVANSAYQFDFPTTGIRMVTSYSADEIDQGHQSEKSQLQLINQKIPRPKDIIDLKDSTNANHIFLGLFFRSSIEKGYADIDPREYTPIASGSNTGTPTKTISTYTRILASRQKFDTAIDPLLRLKDLSL